MLKLYRFEITGNYLTYDDPDSGLQGVKLVGRLVDAEDGTTLGEFPRFVFGPEAVPRLLGLTVNTKGSNDPRVQSAVCLTIDGVDIFAFSEQTPTPQHWVVPAKKNGQPGTTLVRGWNKSDSASIEFKVVDFPKSAAARVNLRPSSNIGMISASFAACWENESDRPRREGRTRATGFGAEIVDQKTRVKRQIGQVRDVVSIRYEREQSPLDPIAMSK